MASASSSSTAYHGEQRRIVRALLGTGGRDSVGRVVAWLLLDDAGASQSKNANQPTSGSCENHSYYIKMKNAFTGRTASYKLVQSVGRGRACPACARASVSS